MKGIIRRKIDERGFGFIGVEGGRDVFFHASDCVSSFNDFLGEGDAVEFELTESKGRHRAIKVRKIG